MIIFISPYQYNPQRTEKIKKLLFKFSNNNNEKLEIKHNNLYNIKITNKIKGLEWKFW